MNPTTPPDVFAEALALFTPERILHHPRTGEGVAVCLVDSGVERGLLQEKYGKQGVQLYPIQGGVFGDRLEPSPYEGRQSAPHGTTVADVILTLAPGVRLYSADVFGPRGVCEVETVIRAIRWAVDVWKCKVVNLSLGVAEQRLQQAQRRRQLRQAVEEAYFKDVLVVAAAHNDHPLTRSYPAAFGTPLLSVDKGLFADPLEFAYNPRGQVEFQRTAAATSARSRPSRQPAGPPPT